MMSRNGGRLVLSRWEAAGLAALTLWGTGPLVAMLVHSATTSDQLTGADGPFAGDQLQYLSWIRDEGSHFLAANDFTIAPHHADFLHPMFVVSGALWRTGSSLALAFQIWKPVAILSLFAGVVAYVRRLLHGRGAQPSAIVIALFFSAPVAALFNWTHAGSVTFQGNLASLAGEMSAADALWGYMPTVIAIGLMPVFLLGIERIASAPRGASLRSAVIWTSAAGAAASWLHPWQGETLVLMVVGASIWLRLDRSCLRLAVPVAVTIAPLLYYLILSKYDPAWKNAQLHDVAPRLPLVALLLDLAPIGLVALAGIRCVRLDLQERLLLLWIPAALAAYFVSPSGAAHALNGISIPLAVFAVRSWQRFQLPTALGIACLAAVTVPGMALAVKTERNLVTRRVQATYLRPDEAAALAAVSSDPRPGGVLTTPRLGAAVPAYTGREVWVGHPVWTPAWALRSQLATQLFTGALRGAEASKVIQATGARFVVSDCSSRIDLLRTVGSGLLVSKHRFGCASVYVVG
jgi:hypothetical protein